MLHPPILQDIDEVRHLLQQIERVVNGPETSASGPGRLKSGPGQMKSGRMKTAPVHVQTRAKKLKDIKRERRKMDLKLLGKIPLSF